MALIPAGSNQSPSLYEFPADTDLVASVLPYASLASLSAQGFGSAKGYVLTGSDYANRLPPCFIYSRNGDGTAGRYWVVTQGTSSKCLVLIVEGSPNAGGGATGADIVRVVAKSATYSSPALSAAVFSTIASAISGAPAGCAILILNDTYTENLTIGTNLALIGFSNASQLTITGTITANAALVLRNMTVDGGSGNALTSTAGDVQAYDCSFISASSNAINSVGAGNIVRLTYSSANDATFDTAILSHATMTGTTTAAVGITAVDSTLAAVTSLAFTARRCTVTGTTTITAGVGTITLLYCTMAALTSSSTNTATIRASTFSGATTLAGLCNSDGNEFSALSGTSLVANSSDFTTLTMTGTATIMQGRATGAVNITGAADVNAFVASLGTTFGGSLTARASTLLGAAGVTGAATVINTSFGSTSTFANVLTATNSSFADTMTKNGALATTLSSCTLQANAVIDAQSTATIDDSRITTSLACGSISMRNSSVGTTTAAVGTFNAWQSVFGTTLTVTSGEATMYNCTVGGAAAFQYLRRAVFTSFLATVTLNNPDGSPYPHLMVHPYLTTGSGNAVVTSSANDFITIVGGYSSAVTNIAVSGTGNTRVVGYLAGGNRITSSLVTASVAQDFVHGKLVANLTANSAVVTLAGGATAAVPDLMIITPSGGTFNLTMYPGSDLPDGYVAVYKNVSTTDSYQLVAGGTDTIETTATTLIGPGDARRYVYSRSGTAATIYEIV